MKTASRQVENTARCLQMNSNMTNDENGKQTDGEQLDAGR